MGKFREHLGEYPFVKASIGPNNGSLYILDRVFLFLEKPSTVIRFEDVETIMFDRQKKGSVSNSFDVKIKLTDGRAHEFNLIPKKEFENMEQFFKDVSSGKFEGKRMKIANYREDGDEQDEDEASDDDADKQRRSGNMIDDEDDDSDSEEDEDFKFDASKAGSESSEHSSDDDSDVQSGSDSEAEKMAKKEKKKEKKEKKHKKDKKHKKHKKDKKKKMKKERGSDDDSDSDGERASPKKKKAKEKKDPNRPKQAKSAYLLFCDETRAKAKAENPEMSMTQLAKVLGDKWKELSEEDKKPFVDQAKVLQDEHKEAMAKYYEENPDQDPKGKKRKKGNDDSDSDEGGGRKKGGKRGKKPKKDKDPNAPKPPKTAYMLFSAENRAKLLEDNAELKATEVFKELGERWKALSAEDKAVWEDKHKADKERYREEMEEYNSKRRASSPTLDEFMGDGSDDGDEDDE